MCFFPFASFLNVSLVIIGDIQQPILLGEESFFHHLIVVLERLLLSTMCSAVPDSLCG